MNDQDTPNPNKLAYIRKEKKRKNGGCTENLMPYWNFIIWSMLFFFGLIPCTFSLGDISSLFFLYQGYLWLEEAKVHVMIFLALLSLPGLLLLKIRQKSAKPIEYSAPKCCAWYFPICISMWLCLLIHTAVSFGASVLAIFSLLFL